MHSLRIIVIIAFAHISSRSLARSLFSFTYTVDFLLWLRAGRSLVDGTECFSLRILSFCRLSIAFAPSRFYGFLRGSRFGHAVWRACAWLFDLS